MVNVSGGRGKVLEIEVVAHRGNKYITNHLILWVHLPPPRLDQLQISAELPTPPPSHRVKGTPTPPPSHGSPTVPHRSPPFSTAHSTVLPPSPTVPHQAPPLSHCPHPSTVITLKPPQRKAESIRSLVRSSQSVRMRRE